MSMEINGSSSYYKTGYTAPEKAKQLPRGDETEKKAKKEREDEPVGGEKAAEKCTTNTDRVDREIKKLKEERKQLMQQIKSASGDEKKVGELKKKLAQIESELSRKDNDSYRRQNASVMNIQV